MNYIKAWQSLPDFGISLFVVKFNDQKKEELLGVSYNRLMRMDISSGDHLKTWRYSTMKVSVQHFFNYKWGPLSRLLMQFAPKPVFFKTLALHPKLCSESR